MTIRPVARFSLALCLALAGLNWEAPPPAPAAVGAPAAACNNLLGDSDFEAALSPWVVSSTPPLVVIDPGGPSSHDDLSRDTAPLRTCDSGTCDVMAGVNDPAGPLSGANWAWFGGGYTSTTTLPNNVIVQTVSQTVTLSPAMQPARLEFSLWLSRADPGTDASDRLEVRLNNTLVFSATAAMTPTYASGYTPVSVDVSSFATGASTDLVISATTRALGGVAVGAPPPPVVNFNVDDVKLCVPFPFLIYLPLVRR